jgi:eukaryotic-like serine/threonine-protein kinase
MDHFLPPDFGARQRLELRRKLGEGASGIVYEAFDLERGCPVAVKVLRQIDAADLYRFKNEFRVLADVVHANLVQLHELFSDGEHWSFSMELVDGLDFSTWCRGGAEAEDESAVVDPANLPAGDCDEERLRAGLAQLAQGLNALHGAGKLHRDLKPSNVLVTREGRVVLLDFGLIRDTDSQLTHQTLHEGIVGTPAYMAPEQAAGLEVGPASDWYAVGVMLYEILAGRPPFSGRGLRVLVQKQTEKPPPPGQFLADRDKAERTADLQALALELLDRDPEKRPSGRAVLRRLGAARAPRGPFANPSTSWQSSTRFFGRRAELQALENAYQASRHHPVTLLVAGPPGSGKSALVRHFLEGLRERAEGPVVLAGRCYPNESLPYKAVDSLMDLLSRYLRTLSKQEAAALMPADVLALTRIFPVLGRVEAIAAAERRVLEVPDTLELRRRAFSALRELFGRLAARRPLVLYIDDLQWGDVDSAPLLAELSRPPSPPPLLLIGCVRGGDGKKPALYESLRKSAAAGGDLELRELELRPLTLGESEDLARHLLQDRPSEPTSGVRPAFRNFEELPRPAAVAAPLVTVLARAAAGNPFFLLALVRYSQAIEEDAGPEGLAGAAALPHLEALVAALLARLPDDARSLLQVVSVAGHPLTLSAASGAARIGNGLQTALTVLRGGKLVIVREAAGNRTIEPYLTRIAEAVCTSLGPEHQRALHARIATALLLDPKVDPEALAHHFREAGEGGRAAEYALRAAHRAREALAFDREVELLRLVLDLDAGGSGTGTANIAVDPDRQGRPHSGTHGTFIDRRQLLIELGNACSNSGRGGEAAKAYLAAADGAKAGEALDLRRQAAEQLLISGRIDEGVAAIEQVLASIGMALPKTQQRAFLSLAWRRLRLKMRGIRFKERDSTQVAAERLIAIDTCWSVTVGLSLVDTVRGLDFGTRGLLLALDAGEPSRIARALALEIGVSSTGGTRSETATEEIVRQAMRLAKKVGDPRIEGLAAVTSGIAAYLRGDMLLARERLERGEDLLRERCQGVTWELDTAITMLFRVLLFLGDWAEVRRRLPAALEGFAARGDLFAETNVRSRVTWLVRLLDDQPEAARVEAAESIARWSLRSFHLQHYWHLTGLTEIALYEGRGGAAWEAIEKRWPELQATHLLRVQFTRHEARHLRLRAALAAMAEGGLDSPAYQRLKPLLLKELAAFEREKVEWMSPLAQLIRAGLAALEGQREEAIKRLEKAIEGCDRHHLGIYGAAARMRLAGMKKQPSGREAAGREAGGLGEKGAKRPDRWCDVAVPGGFKDF